ncbi:hypothetical protein BACCELL_03447 [Bacteroides cellulosilyticus DSM 14838]|uniref:Uncharacterized protein n=1 Tax=Bacteroides cellulosilyticus DSM 14838 TaxID=537012 RepID=E2NGM3_9BACE|nr:hypothetical protein BACCELL_03447 [Bacteroides cellulosilyticus DSM 14838]
MINPIFLSLISFIPFIRINKRADAKGGIFCCKRCHLLYH